MRTARAPGRVNLIGDHTDYAGGLALAMAIDLETMATFEPGHTDGLEVLSDATDERFTLHEDTPASSRTARMLSGLLHLIGRRDGRLSIRTTLPLGAGLSSSASLLVSAALALGATERGVELARLCQAAEAAADQEVGLLDQLTIIGARRGNCVLIDFATLTITQVPLPPGAEITVIHSGIERSLATAAYQTRRREVHEAEDLIGALAWARPALIDTIHDRTLRARASHVAGETARVQHAAIALGKGHFERVGQLMNESHESLRDLFEVSLPEVDHLVAELRRTPGVAGARMTGGGFGGCVVVLAEPGALKGIGGATALWRVEPSAGALVLD